MTGTATFLEFHTIGMEPLMRCFGAFHT